MGLLDNMAAVVTGGAQGIVFAIAEALVAEGARVVLADLDGSAAAAERLGDSGIRSARPAYGC